MDVAFRRAVADARRQGGLPFACLLSEDRILQAFGSARWFWQGWIYSPAVTLWVFLSQCLSADHSCCEAVARLIAWRLARGQKPCSADTGAYCTAREKIPEEACRELVRRTGRQVEDDAPDDWLWLGRRVRSVDGSTITMPDTPANQAAYPQSSSQRPGCGFPILRMVVVFSLAAGTVLEHAFNPYQGKRTGENSLFRTLHHRLQPQDVVLADRYFSGWFDIALLCQRGVDVVLRKHHGRKTDFRTGRRLGQDDHLVCWKKPALRPEWMSRQQYRSLPGTLTLREVRVLVAQPGFRTKRLVVVTTLLDAERYPADQIAVLYRRRWQAELNLRSLKIVLQMDHLRCLTPHRVRNELAMHLVGYNLIRQLMAAAACQAGQEPWTISFKGTLQTINNLLPVLATTVTTDDWCDAVLTAIATHLVGHRPDRIEPRVKKRRPKSYPLMNKPRQDYKRHAA
jgi:hypothetical protein